MADAEQIPDFEGKALCAARLDILDAEDRVRDHATACWYRSTAGRLYLLTNWHVVTGRIPSRPAISRTGFIPVSIRMRLHAHGDGGIILAPTVDFTFQINSPDGNEPIWWEHPILRHRCDVVALAFNELPSNLAVSAIGDEGLLSDSSKYKPQAMHDAFVMGFPAGISGGAPGLPIYKRGSIASDPDLDQGELPRFLIDVRTAAGMSGSPVICRYTGFGEKTTSSGERGIGLTHHERFMGVYSGRLKAIDLFPEIPDPNTLAPEGLSDIGMVWKVSAIEQITSARVVGWRLSEI